MRSSVICTGMRVCVHVRCVHVFQSVFIRLCLYVCVLLCVCGCGRLFVLCLYSGVSLRVCLRELART